MTIFLTTLKFLEVIKNSKKMKFISSTLEEYRNKVKKTNNLKN